MRNGPVGVPAGVVKKNAPGEVSMDQIFPSELQQTPSYNQRNRSLDASDINAGPKRGTHRQSSYAPPPNYVAGVNKSYNPIPRNEEGRPYKNGSSVFAHLEDNAQVRQKVNFGGRPPIDSRKNNRDKPIQKTVPGANANDQQYGIPAAQQIE